MIEFDEVFSDVSWKGKEVIELPQEVFDFLNEFSDMDILSVLNETKKKFGCHPHLEVCKYLARNRENQVKFVKAWTGDYKVIPKREMYGIKSDDGRYLQKFEVDRGNLKRELRNTPTALFTDKWEAETLAGALRTFYDGGYTVIAL